MHLSKRYADLFQMSYITRDMDAAVAHARQELGIDSFDQSESEVDLMSYGERQKLVVRAAIANFGPNQFEIIQPVSGPTHIYTDEVDLSGHILNFHHVAIAVRGGYSEWETLVEEVRATGDEFAFLFPAEPDPETMVSFCYVDTRKRIGHYTEYLWADPSLKGLAAAPWL